MISRLIKCPFGSSVAPGRKCQVLLPCIDKCLLTAYLITETNCRNPVDAVTVDLAGSVIRHVPHRLMEHRSTEQTQIHCLELPLEALDTYRKGLAVRIYVCFREGEHEIMDSSLFVEYCREQKIQSLHFSRGGTILRHRITSPKLLIRTNGWRDDSPKLEHVRLLINGCIAEDSPVALAARDGVIPPYSYDYTSVMPKYDVDYMCIEIVGTDIKSLDVVEY